MKTLRIFILKNCPYCIKALNYINELKLKEPEYGQIKVELIDEKEQKKLADSYNYYYVPAFYYNEVKLHEGAVSKEKTEAILQAVLAKEKARTI